MKKYWSALLMAFILFSGQSAAEQKIVKDNWDIHYIAFPSSFLEPKVAKEYGLIRSKYQAVINISVLDNSNNNKAQRASLSGFAKNLAGQTIGLDFKKVEEGESIYYLSQFKYHDNEPVKFTVVVQLGDRTETIQFNKRFYVE